MPMTQAVQEYFEAVRKVQAQIISQQEAGRRQSIITISRRLSKSAEELEATRVCRLCPQVEGRIVRIESGQTGPQHK